MSIGSKKYRSILLTLFILSINILTIGYIHTIPLYDVGSTNQTVGPHEDNNSGIFDIQPKDDLNWTFAIDVSAGSYHARYAYRSEGTGLMGSFRVTSGNDITFYIVDSDNYNKLKNGEQFECYLLHEKVGSLKWKFRVPYSDTWYIIFDNTYSIITSKHVVGWDGIDRTPPEISINLYDGETVDGYVHIYASADDNHFDVGYIDIRIDGDCVAYSYSDSVDYSWDTTEYTNGYHTIEVYAQDTVGNWGSKEISVYVNNPITTTTTHRTKATVIYDSGIDLAGFIAISTLLLLMATAVIILVKRKQ